MAKTLVIGANGQIGKLLVSLMAEQQQPVRAMIRKPEQADYFQKMGVEVIIADLEQPLSDEAFHDCDKVVFTAGSGSKTGADKTILVDLWGACKAVEMAVKHKVTQFIMVSAQNAGDPENGNPAIKHYNVCKHFADQYLLGSGLPFTILRPGKLIDAPATGKISTQRSEDKTQRFISRADVAQCISHCLTHDNTINHIIPLYQGDLMIKDALV
ncbi:MAG TPA: SDR family oxidoreductase [Methylophaga sp.]|nr:SDR family oxidoreductase [Methylophaga sp.]